MEYKIVSKFPLLLGKSKKKISNVAKDTGISRTTLTSIYYGSGKMITFSVLEKLCDYFQCSVVDIFDLSKGDK